jgi:hypothetical protein
VLIVQRLANIAAAVGHLDGRIPEIVAEDEKYGVRSAMPPPSIARSAGAPH